MAHAAGGAIVSATTGALGMLLTNIMEHKKIAKEEFVEYMLTCDGCTESIAETLWVVLN
jgi:rRNA maturation endonuclease Nob1